MRLTDSYYDFWSTLRIDDCTGRDLFYASKFGPVNYFERTAGITGANYAIGLTKSSAIVQLEVKFNTRNADRKLLTILADAIEAESTILLKKLDSDFRVIRFDHALVVRKTVSDQGSILNRATWNSLSSVLLKEVYRLYDVMTPFVERKLWEISQLSKIERRPMT